MRIAICFAICSSWSTNCTKQYVLQYAVRGGNSGGTSEEQTQSAENIDKKQCYADFFLDRYCSTVQGLLDWFEVDLGFTELSCVRVLVCVCVSL